MKVKDLKKVLDGMSDELTVVISDTKYGMIGGAPVVKVQNLCAGFDWNHGQLIIFPENNMTSVDKETIQSMITYANQAGWRGKYEREIAELTRQLEEIKK